jgi:hypothetical protein
MKKHPNLITYHGLLIGNAVATVAISRMER